MEVLQDIVLEFAEGSVEELGGDGFGAEEQAVDFCLGKAGGLEVGLQEIINHVEVGAVVGLGKVHHVFDFDGAVHVVDFIQAEGFNGVIYIWIRNGVSVQNDVPGVCEVVRDCWKEFELRFVFLLGIGMNILAKVKNLVTFCTAIANLATWNKVVDV